MKGLVIAFTGLGLLGLGANVSSAKSAAGDSAPPPPPVHHSSSAPVTAPVGAAVSHNAMGGAAHNPAGTGSFRPTTTTVTGSGQRTLVYPGVHNSIVRHPANTNLNSVKPVHNGALTGSSKLGAQSGRGTVTKTKLDSQTSAQLRNWHGNVSNAQQAAAKHADHCHHHHDHDWWKHHCVTFIFFDDGWWGWDDGWWYPAWGYDPYSYYEYNHPIYGDVAPEQIVAGVQTELQRRGYYTYSIDGKMGPLTRAALARYQTDHRMNVTTGIDSATLNSLGLIH